MPLLGTWTTREHTRDSVLGPGVPVTSTETFRWLEGGYFGDLRRAGLVDVRHGAGAGWSLARAPEGITLLEVYDAVEQEPLFGMHRTEPNLECPVGRGIQPALGHVYGEIEQALRRELERTSIVDVLRQTLQMR